MRPQQPAGGAIHLTFRARSAKMRPLVRTKLAKFFIVSSLICAVGGHWAILQSVAWIGMAVSYSQDSTFKEALVKTFDGQHPCQLCKALRDGKKSESRHTLLKVETKLDFWLARGATLLYPPPPLLVLPPPSDFALVRFESPPTPPPRCA